jgi:hypothetical protein
MDFDHYDLLRAGFLSWTVRTAQQREAARKWAERIVFERDGRGEIVIADDGV